MCYWCLERKTGFMDDNLIYMFETKDKLQSKSYKWKYSLLSEASK